MTQSPDGEHVDPLLGTDAGDGNIDGVDEPRSGAVHINGDDGETAADAGIDAENIHCALPVRAVWIACAIAGSPTWSRPS
jgi:hypothetical protein